jgi:hypothetical protein
MRPALPESKHEEPILDALPVLGPWVRGSLVGVALGVTLVFVTAWRLNPYHPDGRPRRMETHRELGLPPCNFKASTGLPCPACGMTTSFALLVRGDVVNSLRANAVGTLLAVFSLLAIPWCLISFVLARPLFLVSIEKTVAVIVLVFLGLTMLRWGIVLVAAWVSGTPFES